MVCFGKLDPALGLFEFRDELEIVRPALLVDQVVDIPQVGLEVGEFVLLDTPVRGDTGELDLVLVR